jgi:hypothetical protein
MCQAVFSENMIMGTYMPVKYWELTGFFAKIDLGKITFGGIKINEKRYSSETEKTDWGIFRRKRRDY